MCEFCSQHLPLFLHYLIGHVAPDRGSQFLDLDILAQFDHILDAGWQDQHGHQQSEEREFFQFSQRFRIDNECGMLKTGGFKTLPYIFFFTPLLFYPFLSSSSIFLASGTWTRKASSLAHEYSGQAAQVAAFFSAAHLRISQVLQ